MLQPTHVGFEEGADVRHAVFQHGETIEPAAEGETLIALWIDAAHFEHARMHLARTAKFEPVIAGAVLDLAGNRAVAAQIPFDARLGEREEARARAQLDLVDLEK